MTELQDLRERALEAVRSAFSVKEPPSPDRVRNDHCAECEGLSEIFLGRCWTDITVEDLMGNPALSLLTCEAFRYYLPALMIHSIEAPVELDCVPDGLVALLSPPGGRMNEHDAERLAGFSIQQIEAILSFLQFSRARELNDLWGGTGTAEDVVAGMPTDKVLERAIEYWMKESKSRLPNGK